MYFIHSFSIKGNQLSLKMAPTISHLKTNLKTGYMNCYKNNLNSFGMSLMGTTESSNLLDIKKNIYHSFS